MHVLASPLASKDGVHESLVSCAGAVPPVGAPPGTEIASAPPPLSTAETPVRPTEGLDTPGSKTNVREATTPLGIAVLFVRLAMQVRAVVDGAGNGLPALVAAAPGAAVIEMTPGRIGHGP